MMNPGSYSSNSKNAFTLIEILFVLFLLGILLALIVPKISPLKEKAIRIACAKNIQSLTQAVLLYTSTHEGVFPRLTKNDSADEFFGVIFQKEGWNNLKQLVCPANESGVPPEPNGYGFPLNAADRSIDYWIVFSGNTGSTSNLHPLESRGDNILIIEAFSEPGTPPAAWTLGNHHQVGGNVGRLNGRVEFLTSIPVNLNDSGGSEAISISECSTFP